MKHVRYIYKIENHAVRKLLVEDDLLFPEIQNNLFKTQENAATLISTVKQEVIKCKRLHNVLEDDSR